MVHFRTGSDRVDAATHRLAALHQRVSGLRVYGRAREAAVEAVGPERSRLSADRSAIADTLEPFERSLDRDRSRGLAWSLNSEVDVARAAPRRFRRPPTPERGLDMGIEL